MLHKYTKKIFLRAVHNCGKSNYNIKIDKKIYIIIFLLNSGKSNYNIKILQTIILNTEKDNANVIFINR